MQYLWTHPLRKCTLPIKVDCPQKEYPLPRGNFRERGWNHLRPSLNESARGPLSIPGQPCDSLVIIFWVGQGSLSRFFSVVAGSAPVSINRATDQMVDSSLSSPCFLFPLPLDVFLAVFFASSPTFWVAKEGEIQTVSRWTRRETLTIDRNDAFASL